MPNPEPQKSEVHAVTEDAATSPSSAANPGAEADAGKAGSPDEHEQRERLARREITDAARPDDDESSYGGVLDLDRPDAT